MSLFSRMTEEWNEQLQKAKDGDPGAIKVLPTLALLLTDYMVVETNQIAPTTIRKVGTCKSCRSWTEMGPNDVEAFGDGPVRNIEGCGLCEATIYLHGEETEQGSAKCCAVDYHRDGAVLVTAPDFGCVQWERG